jgi:hypothetical protein
MDLHGVDVYLWTTKTPDLPMEIGKLKLDMISNRGTKVFPSDNPSTDSFDWPQCRYLSENPVSDNDVDALIAHLTSLGWRWTKTQKLYRKDGVDLFSQPY